MNWPETSSGAGGGTTQPGRRGVTLQGPRPFPLSIFVDSRKIGKTATASKPPLPLPPGRPPRVPENDNREPVVIYAVSPKAIHIDASDFKSVVQRLTGRAPSTPVDGGPISPAARLAALERVSPTGRERERSELKNEMELMDMVDWDPGMLDLGQIPGILSPAPANLPALPAAIFSPVVESQALFGFQDNLMSPFMPGNCFLPSPSSASSSLFPGSQSHVSTMEDQELEVGPDPIPHLQNRVYANMSAADIELQYLPNALENEDVLLDDSIMEKRKDCCSIFFLLPEEYEFERDTLIQLWMAGGYIKDELMGHECFHSLLNKECLSHSGTNFMTQKDKYRININKIKDLLDGQRDTANFYLKWENGCQKNTDSAHTHHVSLVCNDIDASIFRTLQQLNELRTLLFLGNYGNRVTQIPDHFFQSFKELRALDMSRTNIKKLPSSVSYMIHLHYLDLSWTLIEWLPDTLCSLYELQTLKLRGCSKLRGLPRQLKNLTKLGHLDVDVLRQLATVPRGIGALVNLRTLSAFLVGTEDGCKIQELKDLNSLTGDFCIAMLENVGSADEAKEAYLNKKQHLNKLELRWTASQFSRTDNNCYDVLQYLQPCSSLKELQIFCYEGSTFPVWVCDPAFDQLVSITFFKCEHVSDLPLFEQLPFLKHLRLAKVNGVKKIERRGKLEQAAFFRLEKLEIDEMQSLEAWSWIKTNDGDFKSLVEITINDCPELHEFHVLEYLSSIKHLEVRGCLKLETLSDAELPDSLEELIVEDCPRIKEKCSQEGEDWYKIQHVSNIRLCVDDDDEEDEC